MITLDIGNTRTRRILVLVALGMGALILGIWWPWGATSGLPVDAETHRVAAGSPLAGQGRPQVGGHPEDASITAGDGRPEGLSEEQWHALNQALAHHPDREREKKRVLAYLRFEQKVLALQALTGSPDTVRRHQLASDVIEQLPVHLSNREVTAGEAEALLKDLALTLEPDASKRLQWMAAQHQRWAAAEPASDVEAQRKAQAQQADYARQAEAIAARWLATPENSRDQAAMERELQRLREKVYGAGS